MEALRFCVPVAWGSSGLSGKTSKSFRPMTASRETGRVRRKASVRGEHGHSGVDHEVAVRCGFEEHAKKSDTGAACVQCVSVRTPSSTPAPCRFRCSECLCRPAMYTCTRARAPPARHARRADQYVNIARGAKFQPSRDD